MLQVIDPNRLNGAIPGFQGVPDRKFTGTRS